MLSEIINNHNVRSLADRPSLYAITQSDLNNPFLSVPFDQLKVDAPERGYRTYTRFQRPDASDVNLDSYRLAESQSVKRALLDANVVVCIGGYHSAIHDTILGLNQIVMDQVFPREHTVFGNASIYRVIDTLTAVNTSDTINEALAHYLKHPANPYAYFRQHNLDQHSLTVIEELNKAGIKCVLSLPDSIQLQNQFALANMLSTALGQSLHTVEVGVKPLTPLQYSQLVDTWTIHNPGKTDRELSRIQRMRESIKLLLADVPLSYPAALALTHKYYFSNGEIKEDKSRIDPTDLTLLRNYLIGSLSYAVPLETEREFYDKPAWYVREIELGELHK